MAEMNTLMDALVDEVRDLYHAEKQLVKALPKLAKAASSDELREAISSHLSETENHVGRLEQVFELLEEKPRAKACAGMAGIIEEGADALKEDRRLRRWFDALSPSMRKGLGNLVDQAKGAEIDRPSVNATVKLSSVITTLLALTSAVKELIPLTK